MLAWVLKQIINFAVISSEHNVKLVVLYFSIVYFMEVSTSI